VAAVGEAFVLDEASLAVVRDAAAPRERRLRSTVDEFWDVLERESTSQLSYRWSGYVLATLLAYLDEKGIRLMHSGYDETSTYLSLTRSGTIFVLTPEQRDLYFERLDPESFDGDDLRRYYEEFTETDAEGVEEPMLGGVRFLRDTLGALGGSTVAVLVLA
jgi:hypothetical protein